MCSVYKITRIIDNYPLYGAGSNPDIPSILQSFVEASDYGDFVIASLHKAPKITSCSVVPLGLDAEEELILARGTSELDKKVDIKPYIDALSKVASAGISSGQILKNLGNSFTSNFSHNSQSSPTHIKK